MVGSALEIFDNGELASLEGLNGITSIKGNIGIMDNPKLVSLSDLIPTTIEGELRIIGNAIQKNSCPIEKVDKKLRDFCANLVVVSH